MLLCLKKKRNLKSAHENSLSYSSRKLILSIYSTSLLETCACVAVSILSADICLHFNIIPQLFPYFVGLWAKMLSK